MATFLEELWSSIFTPGPTPTLLIATNIAFGALQTLLFGLLLATYSIHFAILSVLCGGLWVSINWFSKEVKALQAEEERRRAAEAVRDGLSRDALANKSGMSSDDDTDIDDSGILSSTSTTGGVSQRRENVSAAFSSESTALAQAKKVQASGLSPASAANLSPSASASDPLRQRRSLGDSTADLSTDSEWEKIDDD